MLQNANEYPKDTNIYYTVRKLGKARRLRNFEQHKPSINHVQTCIFNANVLVAIRDLACSLHFKLSILSLSYLKIVLTEFSIFADVQIEIQMLNATAVGAATTTNQLLRELMLEV